MHGRHAACMWGCAAAGGPRQCVFEMWVSVIIVWCILYVATPHRHVVLHMGFADAQQHPASVWTMKPTK